VSGEDREASFLLQRLSVALQRFNAVLLHDIHVAGRSGPIAIPALFLLLLAPGNYTPKDIKNNKKQTK